ncbi:hypothetical protein HYH02_009103 [Chlamydomonas schloesseri]|uniref:Uncharacterized protein n=1 Tax=Chlamydomonas schloesseri TaxID=2026947 RepID=A0A835WB65_9CHLO|nr:hypothetical protein HYH02_009103 [Chlamydomonas schloesseri]|eukprot:KAG2444164.1 hypothetical protein HYH02_009103 [Chlamydomonas schloesseri]
MLHSALRGLQQRAQRRLVVEAELADGDETLQPKQALAGPDSGAAGAPAAGSEPCPSRDRARASLRRLHPTAWLCAEPAASSVSEPSILKPASRLQQAATAAAGVSSIDADVPMRGPAKRLPWAHLAARERAAAVEVGGSGIEKTSGDDEKVAQGRPTQQPRAPQDWSWLASPPWGVAPLPPELAARVDEWGRLKMEPIRRSADIMATMPPGSAPHPLTVPPPPPPPHDHPDPRCAELYRRLHRMTGAAQQLLAVAAAAADAAAATEERNKQAARSLASRLRAPQLAGNVAEAMRLALPPPLLNATWADAVSKAGGPAGITQLSTRVAGRATTQVHRFAGGPGKPLVAGKSPLFKNHAILQEGQGVLDAAYRAAAVGDDSRRSACEVLQPMFTGGEQNQHQHQQQHRQQHVVMAAWDGGTQEVQALLAYLIGPGAQETLAAVVASAQGWPRHGGGVRGRSCWRRLAGDLAGWAGDSCRELWKWLLVSAAEAEEEAELPLERAAAAGGGRRLLWPAGPADDAGGDASVRRDWGGAATEVLRGAVCFLGMYAVLQGAELPATADERSSQCDEVGNGDTQQPGATEGGLLFGGRTCSKALLRDVLPKADRFDPLAMAVAFPAFLLARALHPGRHVSPLEMYDVLLLGQLPDFPDLHWPTDGPGVANRSPAARRRDGPPPPPLSYTHALEVMESCMWEPQATQAMFRALWFRNDCDLDAAVGELVRSWFAAWQEGPQQQQQRTTAATQHQIEIGYLVALVLWQRGVEVSDESIREVLLERSSHRVLLAEAATGPAAAGGAAINKAVAEARAGLAAYGRWYGLTDVLAALPAYRPPAAALAAALRALLLLRIVPGAVPPVAAYLSPEEARRARAGVEAAGVWQEQPTGHGTAEVGGGGGCDVLRLRLPPPGADDISTAALLLCLSQHKLAAAPEVRSSGSRLRLQPAFHPMTTDSPQQHHYQQQQQQQQQQHLQLLSEPVGVAGGKAKPPARAAAVESAAAAAAGTSIIAGADGGGDLLVLDICRAFSPAWPKNDVQCLKHRWPYAWQAMRDLAVDEMWTERTPVSSMLAFLRRNLLERHLGICAAGVQGVVALGRMLVAVAKLREEMGLLAGGAAPAGRDVAVGVQCVMDYGDDDVPSPLPRRQPPSEGGGTRETAAGDSCSKCSGGSGGAAGEGADEGTVVAGEGTDVFLTLMPLLAQLERQAQEMRPSLSSSLPHRREELATTTVPEGRLAAAALAAVGGGAGAGRGRRAHGSSGGGGGDGGGLVSRSSLLPRQQEQQEQQAQKLWLLEVLPGKAQGGVAAEGAPVQRNGDCVAPEEEAGQGAVALELSAAAVLSRLQQRRGEELEEEAEGGAQRGGRGKEARQKLPRYHLKLDVWFFEVAPGRPWELVPPPAERVADWNKKKGKSLLAAAVPQ